MSQEKQPQDEAQATEANSKTVEKTDKRERREIKGNLPYTPYPGSLKAVLEGIIAAERPDKFSNKFLETVLRQTGGGARSVPPFFKKLGFLESDGTPTERYSKFKTESKRGQAAAEGLRAAFSELYRRNEFIEKGTEDQVKDLIVEITGLTKDDNIVRLIYNSFDTIRAYVPATLRGQSKPEQVPNEENGAAQEQKHEEHGMATRKLGISYHINIVLPETKDPMVFDAIFKSLRRNLL